MAKFTSKDHTVVSTAVANAVLAIAIEEEENWNDPPWFPEGDYASQVPFDAISSRSALSGPGNDGQRFAQLQSTIYTGIGQEGFRRGMAAFWRSIVDKPDAFPPELPPALLAIEPHRVGGIVFTGLRGHDTGEAHHRRGYVAMVAAVAAGQPRGEVNWSRGTRGCKACGTEDTKFSGDRKLAPCKRLLHYTFNGVTSTAAVLRR